MLLFDNVTKKYDKDITALDNVCFKADKGEFLFLVGPSGAGKTTLMRLLIREELPTEGNILFDEIEVPKIPRKLLPTYRQRLGIVFQDIKLLENRTLDENINFALEILGKEDKEIKETTDYLLDLVGLYDRKHLFPKQLSGGEQQRGAIARALANTPELLVADEPTGNLDPENAMQVLKILDKINKTGTTVMVISHDKDIVDKMNTRVIRMTDGKITSDSNGGYQCKGKPTPPKVNVDISKPKEKTEERTKDEKTKNTEKNPEMDKTLEKLNKRIQNKLKAFNIINIDLVLNLTDEDMNNMKLTKREKKLLETFVKNYLSQK
jgi:cell division transport system ATP-binding protein